MDQQLALALAGQTALLSEIMRLLVRKGLVSEAEVSDAITELVVRARQNGAGQGFEAAALHLLSILQGWKPGASEGAPDAALPGRSGTGSG